MKSHAAIAIAFALASQLALAAEQPIDRAAMAAKVRSELLDSWKAYEQYAWGHDELRPLSRQPRDWDGQSLLMTPGDSLDTLLLPGLNDQAENATPLIVARLAFHTDIFTKVF